MGGRKATTKQAAVRYPALTLSNHESMTERVSVRSVISQHTE